MMRFSKLGLRAALVLPAVFLAAHLSANAAFACPTMVSSDPPQSMVTSTQVVGTSCFLGVNPANAMRLYEKVELTHETIIVERWQQCDPTQMVIVHRVVGKGHKTFCWRQTNNSCTGNQDWQPTPRCS